MPRLVSIYDTNAYRGLSGSALDDLMALEQRRSVVARPCYQVVQELIAHLADPKDPDFTSSYAAIRRLGIHCRRYDGSRYYLSFVADGLDQVAMSIFKRPLADDQLPESYAALVGDLVDGRVEADWEAYRPGFREVAESVASNRQAFADAILGIASSLAVGFGFSDGSLGAVLADPERRKVLCGAFDKDEVLEGPAGMIIRGLAEETGTSPDQIPPDAQSRILTEYATPLRFFNRILKGHICDGWQLHGPKRIGIGYDVRISFLITQHRLEGAPVCLVSDDKLIHEAAKAAGGGLHVIRLDGYKKMLAADDPLPFD